MFFWSTRYSADSRLESVNRKGITCRVLRVDLGVFGGLRVDQKSSANRPVLYPCRVIGVESAAFATNLPFTSSVGARSSCCWISGGFDLQTK